MSRALSAHPRMLPKPLLSPLSSRAKRRDSAAADDEPGSLCLSAHPRMRAKPLLPPLSSRAKPRDLLCAFLPPPISTELQDRLCRGTFNSPPPASPQTTCSPAISAEGLVPLPVRPWSSVKIGGGRKAHSRSLGFARDDKGESSGFGSMRGWTERASVHPPKQQKGRVTALPACVDGLREPRFILRNCRRTRLFKLALQRHQSHRNQLRPMVMTLSVLRAQAAGPRLLATQPDYECSFQS